MTHVTPAAFSPRDNLRHGEFRQVHGRRKRMPPYNDEAASPYLYAYQPMKEIFERFGILGDGLIFNVPA